MFYNDESGKILSRELVLSSLIQMGKRVGLFNKVKRKH